MNREIKFRFWQSQDKKMIIQGDAIAENRSVFWKKWETTSHVSEPMQFTGIKDKNGKDIYEGDIIQTMPNKTYYREVVFSNGNYYLINPDRVIDMEIQALTSSHTDSVVVGNIFENKDLLTK